MKQEDRAPQRRAKHHADPAKPTAPASPAKRSPQNLAKQGSSPEDMVGTGRVLAGPSKSRLETNAPSAPTEDGFLEVRLSLPSIGTAIVAALALLLALGMATGRLPVPTLPEPGSSASLMTVFLVGLTAGGLSCLAVQSGLLATSIARREQEALEAESEAGGQVAPVLLFLAAKVVAYTLLGAVLGLVGEVVGLSPVMRGWLQVAMGVFMLAMVLSFLDVHPIFRYLAFQPPKRVQRLVREHSRRADALAPLTLGALTVLIPCPITIAVAALAVAGRDPVHGALLMLAFTLGTTPLFFLLGYLATRLSGTLHARFLRLAAVMIAVVAITSIRSGLALTGWGASAAVGEGGATAGSTSGMTGPSAAGQAPQAVGSQQGIQEATIQVEDHGYQPERVKVKAGLPTRISLVTENVRGCTLEFVIPSLGIQRLLTPTGRDTFEIAAAGPGEIPFTCGMGMYHGVIEVVE